jgi:hypothetical protein
MLAPKGGDRVSEQRQNFAFDRDSAARNGGFGNYETARQAKAVVTSGAPELIEAMDSGRVALSPSAVPQISPQASSALLSIES